MSDLSMNEATFREIVGAYRSRGVVFSADDVEEVFNLVHDLLTAEADALRVNEPYATATIREYESAATIVDSLRFDVSYSFEEVYG